MVRLAGTPTEIGEIWGAANKAAIVRDMEVFYLHKAADAAISEDALIERSGMFLRIAHEVAPHWLDEARAIARAAGVHEDLYLGFLADAVRSLFLHECTSYSVSREYTLGGAILFHKTRDTRAADQAAYIVESSLPGIHKFIAVCSASRIDCCMMVNDHGLAGSADYPGGLRPPEAEPRYRGLMNGAILRHIAERASTCDQALGIINEFVKKGYYAGGKVNATHWLFVDRTGTILEVSNNSEHVISQVHTQKVYFSRFPNRPAARQLRDTERPIDFLLFHGVSRDRSVCLPDSTSPTKSVSSMTVEIEPSHPDLLTCAWVSLPAGVGSFPLLMGQRATPRTLLDGTAYRVGTATKGSRALWESAEKRTHADKEPLKQRLLAAGNRTDAADMADRWAQEQAANLLALIRNGDRNAD